MDAILLIALGVGLFLAGMGIERTRRAMHDIEELEKRVKGMQAELEESRQLILNRRVPYRVVEEGHPADPRAEHFEGVAVQEGDPGADVLGGLRRGEHLAAHVRAIHVRHALLEEGHQEVQGRAASTPTLL